MDDSNSKSSINNSSSHSNKISLKRSWGGDGSDDEDDEDKNKKNKPSNFHQLDEDDPRFKLIQKLINLKQIVDTIRRVRYALLNGALNPQDYNQTLVEQARMVGSLFVDDYINQHIDINSYPLLDSFIRDPINLTIIEGANVGLNETTDIIGWEDTIDDLDRLSSQLETTISNMDPSYELSSDTSEEEIEEAIEWLNAQSNKK